MDAPVASAPKDDWRAKDEYDRAHGEVMKKFLAKALKNDKGELILNLDEATTMADVAGRKAAQDVKKAGPQFHVSLSHPMGEHPLDKPAKQQAAKPSEDAGKK